MALASLKKTSKKNHLKKTYDRFCVVFPWIPHRWDDFLPLRSFRFLINVDVQTHPDSSRLHISHKVMQEVKGVKEMLHGWCAQLARGQILLRCTFWCTLSHCHIDPWCEAFLPSIQLSEIPIWIHLNPESKIASSGSVSVHGLKYVKTCRNPECRCEDCEVKSKHDEVLAASAPRQQDGLQASWDLAVLPRRVDELCRTLMQTYGKSCEVLEVFDFMHLYASSSLLHVLHVMTFCQEIGQLG